MPIARDFKTKGIFFPNGEIRAPYIVSISVQSNIDPSWLAQTPETLYNNGLSVCEWLDTNERLKLDLTKADIKIKKEKNIKAIICLGENNEKIISAFKNDVDIIQQAADMQAAVNQSYNLADGGDAVLLSPACASFDLYENFEHRGSEFKKMVRAL